MTVLVTGGSGVVGMHVVRTFAEAGEEVVACSTSGAPPFWELLVGEFAPRVSFLQGDIRDLDRLKEVADRFPIEGIVHTAALTGEAQARARPHDVISVNVGGTANVLELARLRGVRRVVYLGSASEYGRRADGRPIGEEELNIERLYPETKYLGHRLGERYRAIYGLDFLTVRVSSVYGPYTRFNPHRRLVGNTLIAHLCRAAATGEPVELEGGADYPRDWSYAADVARGILLAYRVESPPHRVYNIASGQSCTVAEVVDALRRIAPGARISVGPGQWDDDPFQAFNLRGPLDISRARRDLGFEPRHTLEEGLRAYVDWWRRREEAS